MKPNLCVNLPKLNPAVNGVKCSHEAAPAQPGCHLIIPCILIYESQDVGNVVFICNSRCLHRSSAFNHTSLYVFILSKKHIRAQAGGESF